MKKGVPPKIISIIKAIYEQSTCNVLHKNLITEPIPALNAVKQGYTFSLPLFNVTLDYVMSKVSRESEGIRWGIWGKLTDLDCADGICLLIHSTRTTQKMPERLGKESAKAGLKINVKKTKGMRIVLKNKEPFYVYNGIIERVTQLTYLGSIIDNTGGTEAVNKAPIRKPQAAFSALNKIWHSTTYSTQTKLPMCG